MIKDVEALIDRRRKQMHVHSVMYYFLHTNIIPDATFDKWAVELASLQRDYPQYKYTGYMPSVFESWTGDTGMHLPVTDDALSIAEGLLRTATKRGMAQAQPQSPKPQKAPEWSDVGYERH